MSQEDGERRGFSVVDRRGRAEEQEQSAEGSEGGQGSPSQRSSQADEAGEAGPAGAGDAGAGFTLVGEPHAASEEAGSGEGESLPPVDFSGLALSLATSALYHLGLVADPQTGKSGPKDLRLARHSIDTLELLEEKTQGNLSQEEASLLSNLLTELRMRFVEAGREG